MAYTVDFTNVSTVGLESSPVADALAAGKKPEGSTSWNGGEKKIALDSRFLKPVPITRDNLDVVVKAGWIKKDALCKGAAGDKVPAACK